MRVDRARGSMGTRFRPIAVFFLAAGCLALSAARWALRSSPGYPSDPSAIAERAAPPEVPRASSGRRRLFLAILSNRIADSRLRNVLRKTYLSFDTKYAAFAESPSICSLPAFLEGRAASHDDDDDDKTGCQVVYAFFIRGLPKADPEPDAVYLGLPKDEPHNELLATLRYSRDLAANHTGAFDCVAATNNHVVLEPTRLWEASFFRPRGNNASQHDRFYGGTTEDPSAASPVLKDYLLVSTGLLDGILGHPKADAVGLPHDASDATVSGILDELHGPRSADPLPRLLWEPSPVVVHEKYDYLSFVFRWDEYKDREIVVYEDAAEEVRVRANGRVNRTLGTCLHGPRVLLGIMTTTGSPKEKKRRAMIRETYLGFFQTNRKNQNNHNNNNNQRQRICSLLELTTLQKGRRKLLQECQLAYVFVVGANPDGPTERVEEGPSSPLTIPPPPDADTADEVDLVYLNIRENMKEGKSQSFLKYATTVIDRSVYFDYIAKTDTDTLIIPDRFLDRNINPLPRFPANVRVYGGSPRVKEEIGHLAGPTYNQGSLYFLSVDLARYVTSRACPREELKVFSEDKSVGNFVHSHDLPIKRVKLELVPRCYHHPLKDLKEFREHWKNYA